MTLRIRLDETKTTFRKQHKSLSLCEEEKNQFIGGKWIQSNGKFHTRRSDGGWDKVTQRQIIVTKSKTIAKDKERVRISYSL